MEVVLDNFKGRRWWWKDLLIIIIIIIKLYIEVRTGGRQIKLTQREEPNRVASPRKTKTKQKELEVTERVEEQPSAN